MYRISNLFIRPITDERIHCLFWVQNLFETDGVGYHLNF